MNTANLQLEGLYVCVASLTNTLVAKGVLTREDVDATLAGAEMTALTDYRADDLSDAHRDAVAFPARVLRAINNSASEAEIPRFSEMAKLVGQTKDSPSLAQRAVDDEDPDYSPMQKSDPGNEASMIQDKIQKTANKAGPRQ
jgi:hypothetical protein